MQYKDNRETVFLDIMMWFCLHWCFNAPDIYDAPHKCTGHTCEAGRNGVLLVGSRYRRENGFQNLTHASVQVAIPIHKLLCTLAILMELS